MNTLQLLSDALHIDERIDNEIDYYRLIVLGVNIYIRGITVACELYN